MISWCYRTEDGAGMNQELPLSSAPLHVVLLVEDGAGNYERLLCVD